MNTRILQQKMHASGMGRPPVFRTYFLPTDSDLMDPFLMTDHFWMSEPFFPPHPHAGFAAYQHGGMGALEPSF